MWNILWKIYGKRDRVKQGETIFDSLFTWLGKVWAQESTDGDGKTQTSMITLCQFARIKNTEKRDHLMPVCKDHKSQRKLITLCQFARIARLKETWSPYASLQGSQNSEKHDHPMPVCKDRKIQRNIISLCQFARIIISNCMPCVIALVSYTFHQPARLK